MKNSLFLAVIAIVSWSMAIGQVHPPFNERYLYFISHAQYLDEQKAYMTSATAYDSAFREMGGNGRPRDFYDAACSWALAGNADNAFFYLDKAAREGNCPTRTPLAKIRTCKACTPIRDGRLSWTGCGSTSWKWTTR